MDQYLIYIGQLLGLTLGVMVVCGLVAWLSRQIFMYFVGDSATLVLYASSVIGTPVHELGHALMCIPFAHRITDMKLLQFPKGRSRTLGYVEHSYNRKNRYPYADGGIFFLDGTSISEAYVSNDTDGGTVVHYIYDAEKLNSSTQGILENVSSFSSLETTFAINSDGYITSFTETGTVTDTSGVTRDVNMRIDVSDMNSVYDIPYPVDKLDKSSY